MRRLILCLKSAAFLLLVIGLMVPLQPRWMLILAQRTTGWPVVRIVDTATLLGFLAIAIIGFVVSRKPLRK